MWLMIIGIALMVLGVYWLAAASGAGVECAMEGTRPYEPEPSPEEYEESLRKLRIQKIIAAFIIAIGALFIVLKLIF